MLFCRIENPTEEIEIGNVLDGETVWNITVHIRSANLTLILLDNGVFIEGVAVLLKHVNGDGEPTHFTLFGSSDEMGIIVFSDLPVGEKYQFDILDPR